MAVVVTTTVATSPPGSMIRPTRPPPTRTFITGYANPRKRKLGQFDGADGTGGIAAARATVEAEQAEAEDAEDGEVIVRETEPWRDAAFLVSKPFRLHRLTPVHALPAPNTPEAVTCCRDLRAYLKRHLSDAEFAFPAGARADDIGEPRFADLGHVRLGESLEGTVGFEVEFASAADDDATVARFVLLPPTAAFTASARFPKGISYYPLLLAQAPTPAVEARFLDWMEGRFDCKVSRQDKRWVVKQDAVHSVIQAGADLYTSEHAPLRGLTLVFKPASSSGLQTYPGITWSAPALSAEVIVRSSKRDDEDGNIDETSPTLLRYLFRRFERLTALRLGAFHITNASAGLVDIVAGQEGEPRVRFFRGAEDGPVVAQVLGILRDAAEM